MLLGVYAPSGGSVAHAQRERWFAEASAVAPIIVGPLAMRCGPDPACHAEVDGVTAVIDGRLYGSGDVAFDGGARGANAADYIARRYRRDGAELLGGLRGRFSLVVWDAVHQEGLMTCDVLATKQLFLSRGSSRLLFASELHELLRMLPSRPGPDEIGFLTWLAGGTCSAGRTLYEGVSRLGPGELIELRANTSSQRTYSRPRFSGTMDGSPAELAVALREQLARSVARRVSPGSTGVVLSGGLDSSIVAAFAAHARSGARLRTYSAVFPGAEFDESEKIRKLTAALGAEAAAFTLEPRGTLRLALEHTRRWELPLTGAGALIDIAMVAEAARDGMEVVLDGQTGDEVLGFSPYLVADRLRRGQLLGALELAGRWPLGRTITRRDKRWILRNIGLKGAVPYRLGQFVIDHRQRDTAPSWLLPARRRQFAALQDPWAWKAAASGPRWWRYLVDVLIHAPHRELRLDYLRHRAAAAGVAGESPLYDHDLIDFCLRLPPELAFDARFTRPLAREAVRGVIPDEVRLQTRKAVFSSFVFEAVTGPDAPGIDRLLSAPDAELGAYVDMALVRSRWQQARSGAAGGTVPLGTELWRLAAAECWLRFQGDQAFVDEFLASADVAGPAVHRASLGYGGTFSPLAPAGPLA